ncbi:MAG: histidine triad nucleotide-binding protein [Myxococcales bacterium]|jgi:histidine triad (HIT) family protein
MPDCLFCRIRDGQLPARKVYEDELALAFEDINPQAPMHVLVIPRKHIPTLNDLTPEDEPLVGHLFTVAARIAKERGHSGPGWRAVMNCNALAGQTVFHLHLHVLGGRPLEWPPG